MAKIGNEKKRIQDEFDQIQSESYEFDASEYLASLDDLPDLGEMQIYDYDADLTTASKQSFNVLESLVDLYLSDLKQLKQHPYIKNKMKEDAMVYAEALFLSKMTRKNFLSQLRQIDNGDNSARMHEVVNQTIGQIRENSKFLSSQRTELEKFYKTLRKDVDDISDPEIVGQNEDKKENSTGKDDFILDNKKMNDLIKNAMISKEKYKEDKKNKK